MLPLYKKILIAIDFSDYSTQAFKNAIMLARQNKAEIHVLHVIQAMAELDPYFTIGADAISRDFEHRRRAALLKELDDLVKKELTDFPEDMERFVGAEVLIGNPAITILDYTARKGIDVIVLGSHGRGMVEKAILGSVSEKILRKSLLPVFVIPLKS
jgi:nucleotide-binding universal stress UspA family protein